MSIIKHLGFLLSNFNIILPLYLSKCSSFLAFPLSSCFLSHFLLSPFPSFISLSFFLTFFFSPFSFPFRYSSLSLFMLLPRYPPLQMIELLAKASWLRALLILLLVLYYFANFPPIKLVPIMPSIRTYEKKS